MGRYYPGCNDSDDHFRDGQQDFRERGRYGYDHEQYRGYDGCDMAYTDGFDQERRRAEEREEERRQEEHQEYLEAQRRQQEQMEQEQAEIDQAWEEHRAMEAAELEQEYEAALIEDQQKRAPPEENRDE